VFEDFQQLNYNLMDRSYAYDRDEVLNHVELFLKINHKKNIEDFPTNLQNQSLIPIPNLITFQLVLS
jgi:hypothetical protein